MNKILNNKALTLVELLVAITVFSALMIIATSMIIQSFDIINRSSEQVSTNQLAEIMLEDITNNLRIVESVVKDENNLWEFKFPDNYVDDKIEIKFANNKLKLEIDDKDKSKKIRFLEKVEDYDIEIIEKEEDGYTGRIIIKLNVKDETGKIIEKRKTILARNLS